jgi:hypothetical protein
MEADERWQDVTVEKRDNTRNNLRESARFDQKT